MIIECLLDKVLITIIRFAKHKAAFKVLLDNIVMGEGTLQKDNSVGKFEINIPDISEGDSGLKLFEFYYEVMENILPIVVTDFNSEENRNIKNLSTLPIVYLDDYLFSRDKKYQLSKCKSKLINKQDNQFNINLKCDSCRTYFWNVPRWIITGFDRHYTGDPLKYCLFRRKSEEINDLICCVCFDNLYSKKFCSVTTTADILKLRFHCRFDCGMICSVWDLKNHENSCDFNLEQDSDKFVKKSFNLDFYNDDDLFIKGNLVFSFSFEVAFYSSAVFGPRQKVPNWRDIVSTEIKTLYCVTDDGLKCKIFYKYDKGHFYILVDHEYDKNRYFVTIISRCGSGFPLSEMMYSENCQYLDLGIFEPEVKKKSDGSAFIMQTPFFIINLREVPANCNVRL